MTDNTQKITIKEFRMWLQGVEEMQDTAWVPNPTQWQRIREKINSIGEEVAVQASVQLMPPQQIAPPVSTPGNDYPVRMATPGLLSVVPSSPSMPVSGPSHGLFATPETPQMPIRTPNIDTTNGQYQSTFA